MACDGDEEPDREGDHVGRDRCRVRRSPRAARTRPQGGRTPPVPIIRRAMAASPDTVEHVAAGLRDVGYLPGESTALVSFLAAKLGKPILVEGPAGVGKTELAKALSTLPRPRRSCACSATRGSTRPRRSTSGTTASSCCGSRPRPRAPAGSEVQDDIFGEEFLLERPLMTAIASAEPVVLLIDEIDKTDQEFEAMLLELLSDFQISIPELGRVEAQTQPLVLLTSNNTRELTEALKRRCLYLWLDYPDARARARDRPLHAPELDDARRAQARRGRRDGPRARPQEAAVDRRVDRLGARAAAARRRRHRRRRRSATRCRSSSSTAPTSTSSPSASA